MNESARTRQLRALLASVGRSAALVSANAAFIACYGLGTIIGPPLVGALMDHFGANALPIALGCVSASIFICATAASVEWRQPEEAIS